MRSEPTFGPHQAGDYQIDATAEARGSVGETVWIRLAECRHCGAYFNPTSSGTRCAGNLLPPRSEGDES